MDETSFISPVRSSAPNLGEFARHRMGEARYELWEEMSQPQLVDSPRMRSLGARPLPAKGYHNAANDQLRRFNQLPLEPPAYEQTLLYPPFATFDVEVVNAVLSNLSHAPTVSMPKLTPNALSSKGGKATHIVLKFKHSKLSSSVLTSTNRPKKETQPAFPLHANWHLNEA